MIDWNNINPDTSFRGKKLNGVDFSGRTLVGVDFAGSDLHECNFDRCDLSHASFEDADLYRASFRDAILYGVRLKQTNLTRCDFSGAYVYGFQVSDYCNVTYSRFENIRLEGRRRSSKKSGQAQGQTEHHIGGTIADTAQLCQSNYFANGYVFTFRSFDRSEQFMQRSQAFNRLKRLYSSNLLGEDARRCYYFERYYRTRSWYKYHTTTGEKAPTGDIRNSVERIVKTFAAFMHEQLAGYGLRPNIVLRNFGIAYLAFFILVCLVLAVSKDSGLLLGTAKLDRSATGLSTSITYQLVGTNDIATIAYFCFFSMFAFAFQNFAPFGHLVWITSLASVVGLALLALYVSTLFSSIRLD